MVMRYLGGVNSPSYNPLAANVTTGTTVVQDGGVYTVASAAQANGRTQWVNDPFFSSDTILLQADNFANGSQNNTFLDSSTNNFTVTRAGNATQGAFNPVATPNGYWANNFTGATTTYLATPSTSALSFGTGNFSFEVFGFAASWPAVWRFITTPTPFSINGDTTSGLVKLDLGAGGVSTGITLPINTWFHFVVTRQSGTVRAFLNGVLLYTVANSTNFSATGITYIGGIAGFSQAWSGYLSNLRVVNGNVPTAYQTSSTTLNTLIFTPPIEPLTTTSQGAPGTNTVLTCQSNRFIDNGTSPIAIAPTNAVSVVPSSPFRTSGPGQFPATQWGASMSFNGTNQYLSVAGNSNLAFGTGDFTIEMFVYLTGRNAGGAYGTLYSSNDASTFGNYPDLYLQQPTGGTTPYALVWYVNTTDAIKGTTPLNTGTWYHVVASRVSGNTRLFLNGVQEGPTYADSTNYINGTGRPFIAANAYNSTTNISGYISNLRVLKGTGFTSVTVPTAPLTAVTNTQLLTCQGSAVDSSTNNFTITNTNSVTASTSGPFTIPGSTGSMYFDGTGDYLTLTGSSSLAFGTGDFTIECWFSLNALPVSPAGSFIYDSRPTADGAYPCLFVAPTTNVLTYYVSTAARITGTTAIRIREWNYVVVSRVSGSTRLFLNGVQEGSTYTDATNYLNGASRPVIANNGLNLGGPLTGYISNLRVLKGTGVTTAPVPTTPLTAITNTQLLLNGTNAGIYDASARTAAETVGNAQVTTAIKKYGSGSMAFDGTGDWLLVPNSPDINFGTGDFTVECWLNMTNTTTTRHLIGKGTATTGWAIYFNAAPTLFIFEYAGSISYSSNYNLIPGQWYHLAIVRSGLGSNNFKMFINGFLIHEATITNDLTTTSNMYVGASRTATNSMFGYIDDLRISKFARYTGPFIPPAVAMQDQG